MATRQLGPAARRRRADTLARRRQQSARSARERILATADRLFYGNGIQAVGVQRLIDESQVTRVTFYRHFPSKDDLVIAYLEERVTRARAAVQSIVDAHPGDPRAALHAWAVALTEDGMIDEYRGCTFVNAAAEYEPPDHPVRAIAVDQRRWVNQITAGLLREAGHPDPAAAARLLMALRTGYVFSLGLEEGDGWAEQYVAAYDQVVDQRLPGGHQPAVDPDVGPGHVGGGVAGEQQHQVGDLLRTTEPAGDGGAGGPGRHLLGPGPGGPPDRGGHPARAQPQVGRDRPRAHSAGPPGCARSTSSAVTAASAASWLSSAEDCRAPAITRAPLAARARVTARPIPRLAPVTRQSARPGRSSAWVLLAPAPLTRARADTLGRPRRPALESADCTERGRAAPMPPAGAVG